MKKRISSCIFRIFCNFTRIDLQKMPKLKNPSISFLTSQIGCEEVNKLRGMNLPQHYQRIYDILQGFDEGKSLEQIVRDVYPNDKEPIGQLNNYRWVKELFENRGWYEDRLLYVFPGIRRRLYGLGEAA